MTVKIDGVEYELDVRLAKTAKALNKKSLISIGQRYKSADSSGQTYILSQPQAFHVCLIGLTDGNRYNEVVQVGNIEDITPEEWSDITNNDDFKMVSRC